MTSHFAAYTYQSLMNVQQHIKRFQPEADILPVRVHHTTRLRIAPRQEVIVTPIKYGVCRLRRAATRRYAVVQFVAIVTDAQFELDRCVDGADHGGV